jgi:hypothetical protein
MTEIGFAGTVIEIEVAGTEAKTTIPSMWSTLTTILRAYGSRAHASSANMRNVSAITPQLPPMNTPAQKGARAGLGAGVSERSSNPHGLNLATVIVRPGTAKIPNCRPRLALRKAIFGDRLPMRPLSLPARCAGGIRQRAPAKEMFLANGKIKGQGRRGYQSGGMVRQSAETPSINQPSLQSNQGQARKWRSDSSPVKKGPPSSVNVDQSPSEWSMPSYSKPNDSRQRFRAKESDFSGSSSPSYSRAKKSSHAARVERSQGRSQRSSASYSRPNRPSQAARVERSKGGSHRSAASYSRPNKPSQPARVERSQGRSQRSAPSYSKPDRPQSGGATGKKGGGGQKSGKKGDKGKD